MKLIEQAKLVMAGGVKNARMLKLQGFWSNRSGVSYQTSTLREKLPSGKTRSFVILGLLRRSQG